MKDFLFILEKELAFGHSVEGVTTWQWKYCDTNAWEQEQLTPRSQVTIKNQNSECWFWSTTLQLRTAKGRSQDKAQIP
jgi:hypothetical protein